MFKQIIAIIMSIVTAFGSTGIIGSLFPWNKPSDKEPDFDYPVVIVPGINHSPTYLEDKWGNVKKSIDGTEIGGTLLIFDNNKLITEIPKLVVPLLGSLFLQRDCGLKETAYNVAKNIFSVQKTDENGNTVNNLVTRKFNYPVSKMSEEDKDWFYRMLPVQKLSEEIGENNIYLFTFNLVGSPMQAAKELNDYIAMVKKQTGKDKVTLVNVSLGGTVFTAFIDEYGYKDIHQVVNIVAATNGTDIVADMLMRKFNISDQYFYNDYISMIAEENLDDIAYGYLINLALRLLPKDVFQGMVTRVMDALIENMMMNTPEIWSLVPSERYEEVCGKYFKDGSKPVLKAKLDRYHEAQLNLRENVLEATNAGVRIDNICGSDLSYGEGEYTFFNIMLSADKVNSDGIIPLYSAGMGATGAPKGQTLSSFNEKYTNKERTVDLSTSVLPDNTWVFVGQHHEVGNNSVVLNLAKELIVRPETLPTNSAEGNAFPMFNGSQNDKYIRRWRLNDAESIDLKELSKEDANEIKTVIAQMKDVLNGTVANAENAEKVTNRTNAILTKLGILEPEKEDSKLMVLFRNSVKAMSEKCVELFGANGYSDAIKDYIKGIFDK